MNKINANPTKNFFVDMLTRDIELEYAILDLLDNCIDGALRENKRLNKNTEKPYKDYYANINFDENKFSIDDNCGGIPIEVAEKYAFRMGRPLSEKKDNLPTVGIYGIGMKRAIFKIGRHIFISSKTYNENFITIIDKKWLTDDIWELPIRKNTLLNLMKNSGTKIIIKNIKDEAAIHFKSTDFIIKISEMISEYYSLIIDKGFRIKINGKTIEPKHIYLLLDSNIDSTKKGISPFIYSSKINNVNVNVVIGFYRDFTTTTEEDNELSGKSKSENAGWTIIANDRVVLYADKTIVTGWGDSGIPKYHTQFISIAGVVEFKSEDASLLPIRTTKRGVDSNSVLYLQIKVIMKEGLKLFTDYTNKWKSYSEEEKSLKNKAKSYMALDIINKIKDDYWDINNQDDIEKKKFKPDLPIPHDMSNYVTIQYKKKRTDVSDLSEYIFNDKSRSSSEVGSYCFDYVLERAKNNE